ncbi:MAG: polysaccharide biosynthesis/export family protein [Ginsengibacter sp.]
MTFRDNIIGIIFKMFIAIFVLTSCNTTKKIDKDFLYFQTERDNIGIIDIKDRIIQINDILSIQVLSKTFNQQEAVLFNMPSAAISQTPGTGAGINNLGYVVGINGNIEFPIIGSVKAVGLTRTQLQENLTEKITPYVKDPSVSIRSLQFNINVLGEVKSPGTKTFPSDRVTILDAISASGDLTDVGKRKDITVIREENGKNLYIQLDLTSGSLFQSPGYQLQPNDIVYVGANMKKLQTVNKNPNAGATFRTVGTALNLALTLLNLYFNRIQ